MWVRVKKRRHAYKFAKANASLTERLCATSKRTHVFPANSQCIWNRLTQLCVCMCVLRMRRNRARKFYILLFRSPKFAVTSCMHSLCRAARVIRFPRAFFFVCISSRRSSLFCVCDERLWVLHPLTPATSLPLHVMYATDWFSFFYVVNKSKFTFLIRIVMLLLLSWRCVPCNEDIGLRNWV